MESKSVLVVILSTWFDKSAIPYREPIGIFSSYDKAMKAIRKHSKQNRRRDVDYFTESYSVDRVYGVKP
jgi:hypothetical protein